MTKSMSATFPMPMTIKHHVRHDNHFNPQVIVGEAVAIFDSAGRGVIEIHGDDKVEKGLGVLRAIICHDDLLAALEETLTIAMRNERGDFVDRARAAILKARA